MAVEEAERRAASGQAVAAAELLAEAARSGDAEAAMLLAVWLLRGAPLRRDLAAAVQALERKLSG